MAGQLRLMCILAHPDDESLGVGGSLAKYASERVETYLVTATRGERGRFGDATEKPPMEIIGETRERELHAAAKVLGIREVSFLDYVDGDLDQADPTEAVGRIVRHIRRVRPHVVITFAPDGAYGHIDHIAISQFTLSAVVCATDPSFQTGERQEAHRVSKLYFMAWTKSKWAAYQDAFKDLKYNADGVERRAEPWPDWEITTEVDTSAHWQTVWEAVRCHQTQLTIYAKLANLAPEYHEGLWGRQQFYRVFSLVNGGRKRESDLFEGLRQIWV